MIKNAFHQFQELNNKFIKTFNDIMPLINEVKLKDVLQYSNKLATFNEEFEKFKFLKNINETLIFQTYKHCLSLAGD